MIESKAVFPPILWQRPDGIQEPLFYGLTKRELFAAMAMQGMLAESLGNARDVVEDAVIYADSLIIELAKSSPPNTEGKA